MAGKELSAIFIGRKYSKNDTFGQIHTGMTSDERYMLRCLELAANGLGRVAPNPMVGCVIVHNDKVIGEGYHAVYGGPHAEVNAIANVKDPDRLASSTLYVNLEPCAHTGKTPPCADLIIEKKISRVVIGMTDPYHEVAGKGIRKLEENGIEVRVNVLEPECRALNSRFITYHQKHRPYVILKWAQTLDGFIGRSEDDQRSGWITNNQSTRLVHKWRSEEQSIMVGTNTALRDNPRLTTRLVSGKNPLRIAIDRSGRIPLTHHLYNGESDTAIFTEKVPSDPPSSVQYVTIDFKKNIPEQILRYLYTIKIQSIIIEGGSTLLKSFIDSNLWDEARIFTGNVKFSHGIKAPEIDSAEASQSFLGEDRLFIINNTSAA